MENLDIAMYFPNCYAFFMFGIGLVSYDSTRIKLHVLTLVISIHRRVVLVKWSHYPCFEHSAL